MKVTALIPDDLVRDIKKMTKADTITEAFIIALEEWRKLKRVKALNKAVRKKPLKFTESARRLRAASRS